MKYGYTIKGYTSWLLMKFGKERESLNKKRKKDLPYRNALLVLKEFEDTHNG